MKKKVIFCLLFLFCLPLFTAGVYGCGEQSPSLTSVVIVADDKEYTEYTMGSFHLNEEIITSVPQVYAKYSDNTKCTLYEDTTGFEIYYYFNDGSSNQPTTNFFSNGFVFSVGTYTAEYRFKGFTVTA